MSPRQPGRLQFLRGESFAKGTFLAGFLFGYIVLILIIYRPIHETVLLRYFYSSEEIQRDNLHVVEILRNRDIIIIISNGDRQSFDTGLTWICLGLANGLTLAWLALAYWAFPRLKRRFPQLSDEEDAASLDRPSQPEV
jgi:hypothetical protein